MGVTIEELGTATGNCPFNFNFHIDYSAKCIRMRFDRIERDTVGALIHEAGHVIACNTEPRNSKEYPFLGWEFALALELNVLQDLLFEHADYGITDDDTIGMLSEDELSELIEERLDYARSIGIVDANDRALAIR